MTGARRLDAAVERTAVSVLERLKARSVKIIRKSRSKKKKVAVRRTSEDAAVEKRRTSGHATERVVHFDVSDKEDERSSYVRQDPFRRSSKFRQPLKRVSRVKGSPPPSYLARIRPLPIPEDPLERCLCQPNFDQTSDGEENEEEDEEGEEGEGEEEEEEEEKKLPSIFLQNLQNASDGESSEDESEDSRGEDENYTVLPAVTLRAEEKERQEIASNPLASCERETSRRATFGKVYVRRRSSYYRASVRRQSVQRASLRRGSLRRPSTFTGTRRRSSVVTATVRRRSSAVPGYVYRRRSVGTHSPYASYPLQHRKKRRRMRRPYRRPRKIVVIGDMCSGKTSLISAYCRDQFSDLYVPTILTSCMTDAEVLGEKIELVVVEVAGRVDYTRFHQCAYKKMDLVILCYSADNPKSLRAIKDHWVPELTTFAPNVPYILVGTKKDIREEIDYETELSRQSKTEAANNNLSVAGTRNGCGDDLQDKFVTTRQGLEAAELIGAKDFIECSAMYRDRTRDVFETAAKIALRQSPRRKKKHTYRAETCTIL